MFFAKYKLIEGQMLFGKHRKTLNGIHEITTTKRMK